MGNYVATVYTSAADVETALETIDSATVVARLTAFMEAGKQKFMVVQTS